MAHSFISSRTYLAVSLNISFRPTVVFPCSIWGTGFLFHHLRSTLSELQPFIRQQCKNKDTHKCIHWFHSFITQITDTLSVMGVKRQQGWLGCYINKRLAQGRNFDVLEARHGGGLDVSVQLFYVTIVQPKLEGLRSRFNFTCSKKVRD